MLKSNKLADQPVPIINTDIIIMMYILNIRQNFWKHKVRVESLLLQCDNPNNRITKKIVVTQVKEGKKYSAGIPF